jgi:hypothetical protein
MQYCMLPRRVVREDDALSDGVATLDEEKFH